MKRVITITMDINESEHSCWRSVKYTEDGKKKDVWTVSQAISTGMAMIGAANDLLESVNTKLIEQEDASAKAEDERVDDLTNMM